MVWTGTAFFTFALHLLCVQVQYAGPSVKANITSHNKMMYYICWPHVSVVMKYHYKIITILFTLYITFLIGAIDV